MKVSIIKYNAGNIRSVDYALRRLGIEAEITADEQKLRQSDRVIFPGVGEASSTMEYMRREGLDRLIPSLRQPVLGICLGMQLLCHHSEEGQADALNIFDSADVLLFRPKEKSQKVPHMGWNSLRDLKGPLYKGIEEGAFVYFVHSYYVPLTEYTIGTTEYILPFSASLQKGNFFATQFHPEKSGKVGEQILRNFIELNEKGL
ncbi:MAG: imidazole glycerol phosphate synthase subunit HisH [Bacteroidaceae bacterium]|jgi:glutamine amidotransferase